jgi:hypothetical protein
MKPVVGEIHEFSLPQVLAINDDQHSTTTSTLPKDGRKAPNFSYGDERCCGFSRLRAIAGL